MKRAEAVKRGEVRYTTGKPCRRGHVSERRTKDGKCLECKHTARKERYRRDDPYRAELLARNRARPQEQKLWYGARARAKYAGVPFNLTVADIQVPAFCPVLGIPIMPGERRCGPNSPTLDRNTPERGYVRGNVTVMSFRANTIKSDATADELAAVTTWLRPRGIL